MKKYVGTIAKGMLIAISVVFLSCALIQFQKAKPLQQNFTIAGNNALLNGNKVFEIKAAEAERENEIGFTAWRERKDMAIYDKDKMKQIRADVLELFGSSELLIPYGKILNEEDTAGCLLGEGAAEELFGNRNAEGRTLYFQNRSFLVRGILKTPEKILIVENHEDTGQFERITVERTEAGRKGADIFMERYNIPGKIVCLQLFETEQILTLIPGKWSDFSGWRKNLKDWNEEKKHQQALQKSSMEMLYLHERRQGILFLCVGIACILAAGKEKGRQ